MEISSANWLSELEMEDPTLLHPYQMNSLGYPFNGLNFQSCIGESNSSYDQYCFDYSKTTQNFNEMPQLLERPAKQQKTSSWNSCSTTEVHIADPNIHKAASSSSSGSQLISFEQNHNSISSSVPSQQFSGVKRPKSEEGFCINQSMDFDNKNCLPKCGQGMINNNKTGGTLTRSPLHAQDHVMAERKRREKLSQRFIALSAIVPGLKKMDKASVLGDAINYMKQLQERVNSLEQQVATKTVESVVFVNRSHLYTDDDISSSDENFDDGSNQLPLPEIEARVSNKNVLIRIYCEKHIGSVSTILTEIEKLHLIVHNSCALPFGTTTLDITIVAQMDEKYSMTTKDLVRNLKQALLQFL
ncbi:Transcription factor bHLH18 [Quillaja saponaria]|uniref:Transcription factor bHLH18 n=1 Tax=Quillaja saponaria TaxID=32244 RepID=A0AAD7L6V0_QUISA|nr:Transcription factor bHLH18 [Quillaja saponaria]